MKRFGQVSYDAISSLSLGKGTLEGKNSFQLASPEKIKE
jgi:hypothetical protein